MQFSELYGDYLDRELGTGDRTQRFTTARRKTAVNQGQDEFIRQTGALVIEAEWTLADGDDEVAIDTIIQPNKFMRFASRQPYIKIDDGTSVRYYRGKDFPRKDLELMDRDEPGWDRSANRKGRPQSWYLRDDGDAEYFGIYPAAEIQAGYTWTLVIPFVAKADTMTADAAIPFDGKLSLTPYHQALVHYAAAQLEKLRRNYQVSASQLDAFNVYVQEYIGNKKDPAGDQVSFAHGYFTAASRRGGTGYDPLRDDV